MTTHIVQSEIYRDGKVGRPPKIPRYIIQVQGGTFRGFKRAHRDAIRRALKALREARYASIYSPGGPHLWTAQDELEKALSLASDQVWK
jgi:hypothetical protein